MNIITPNLLKSKNKEEYIKHGEITKKQIGEILTKADEYEENINILEGIIGYISPLGKEKAKDIKLNDKQIQNLKIIKEKLGINIIIDKIEEIKDIELNDEQINNIKTIKNELGISILSTLNEIEKTKNIKLNEQQIKNIKIIKYELGFNIGINDIEKVKNIKQTDIEKIKNLKIPKNEDDLNINNKELNEEEIINIKILKNELKININEHNINIAKGIKLTQQEIKNIKILKNELRFVINILDIEKSKGIKLTQQEIKNIKILKNEIRIYIGIEEINDIKDIELNDMQIKNIKILKNELGYEVKKDNIKKLGKIDFKKIEQIKNLGVNINKYNIIKLDETEIDFNKLLKLKNFGININENNIIKLNETTFEFSKLLQIKEKIKKFGININENNIIDLNNIKIENFQRIEKIYNEFGFVITLEKKEWESINLTEEEITKLKSIRSKFVKYGTIISTTNELKIILDILTNTLQNKKTYIRKKQEYLQKNLTLGKEEIIGGKKINKVFDQLFKDGNDKGKYGIQNIHQTELGYCYAYSGFELLKKSNFFDVLIKTSMKETETGWEVKIPLADPKGHIIKVNKDEIDKKYSFIDIDSGKKKENVNINSNSTIGQKILEIAFIKEFLINLPKYLTKEPTDAEDLPRFEKRKKIIEKIKTTTKNNYEKTGDITITGEQLNLIEGGLLNNFLEQILGNVIDTHKTHNLESIKPIFNYVNSGIVKIGLSYSTQGIKPEEQKYGINGSIESSHAYSVERTYIKNNEMIIVFVNPHDTSKKQEITLDECVKKFDFAEITTININKLYNNKE